MRVLNMFCKKEIERVIDWQVAGVGVKVGLINSNAGETKNSLGAAFPARGSLKRPVNTSPAGAGMRRGQHDFNYETKI